MKKKEKKEQRTRDQVPKVRTTMQEHNVSCSGKRKLLNKTGRTNSIPTGNET